MAIKIRKSIFETNSSSMHSLSIGKEPKDLTPNEEYSDVITLGVGEYGWGYEVITTWLEKADYLAVNIDPESDRYSMLTEAIHKQYPNLIVKLSIHGYIDHQSYGVIWENLNSTQEVYNMLFGRSTIIIDNDN
jgi:hypothetical protein